MYMDIDYFSFFLKYDVHICSYVYTLILAWLVSQKQHHTI